ncbi:MAG: cytochrome b [Ectothiorhodospiraceae bacterium]|jgi:cytochrome b561
MAVRNTVSEWGIPARVFHWLVVAGVAGLSALGWVMVYWPLSPTQFRLYAWHKAAGVIVLGVVLLRLLWRLSNRAPALPDGMPLWERRAAHLSHWALYALLFALPITGYLINSAANFPLSVFGLFTLPNLTGENPALEDSAKLAHLTLFWILAAVVAVHVAAALKHHFIDRDDVLRRMLGTRRKSQGDR